MKNRKKGIRKDVYGIPGKLIVIANDFVCFHLLGEIDLEGGVLASLGGGDGLTGDRLKLLEGRDILSLLRDRLYLALRGGGGLLFENKKQKKVLEQ